MRKIGCPLCGQDETRSVVRTDYNLTGASRNTYHVVECKGCQFRYLNPRPDPEELAGFYDANYPAHILRWDRQGKESPEQASLNRRFDRIVGQRLALVHRFVPVRRSPLRILDVGCGNGAFLLGQLKQGGVEAWGLDIAESALDQLRRIDGRLHLVAGDIHGADLPRGYFDAITLWHALEHDGDPVGVLRRCCELLRPGGAVLAEVPNADGLIARLCGRWWLGWDLPRHLVHFSAASLRRAAKRSGLSHVRVHRQYTMSPLVLSPTLASLGLWRQRRKGRRRVKPIAYQKWDGPGDVLLRVVNGMERLLGGNGLLLTARAPMEGRSRCAA